MENLKDYKPNQLEGKRILITGGSTGIGRATAILLAQFGAKIMITGRERESLNEAVKGIKDKTPDADVITVTSDQATEEGINLIFEEIDNQWNGLDVLINNAGIAAEGMTKGDYEEWQYVLDTNLLGYMACANASAKRMKAEGGHIVNVGSMSAEVKNPESTVYVATKSGIRGFTSSLRKEVNPDKIKVTLIEPGSVSSDMQETSVEEQKQKIESLEMLEATDIAASIVYVLSQPLRCNIVGLQIRPLLEII